MTASLRTTEQEAKEEDMVCSHCGARAGVRHNCCREYGASPSDHQEQNKSHHVKNNASTNEGTQVKNGTLAVASERAQPTHQIMIAATKHHSKYDNNIKPFSLLPNEIISQFG